MKTPLFPIHKCPMMYSLVIIPSIENYRDGTLGIIV